MQAWPDFNVLLELLFPQSC